MSRTLLRLAMLLAGLIGGSALATTAADAQKIQRATQLVDEYYGDSRPLNQAAVLVGEVLAVDRTSADAYVQAARITVKGGHIVSDSFAPGTVHLYEKFVDRALEIDPNNVEALSLKAEIYLIGRRDLPGALAILQRCLSLDPSYPWTHLHFAKYYQYMGDAQHALNEYGAMISKGAGDGQQRRVYPSALLGEARLLGVPQNVEMIRDFAAKADAARNPKDAWTLGGFAEVFAEMGFFDDSLLYARKAISVMNYGVARRTLAMALYGKATQLSLAGKESSTLLREADAMNFESDEIMLWFAEAQPSVAVLAAPLRDLLQKRPRERGGDRYVSPGGRS